MIDLGLDGKRAVVSGAGYIPSRAGHGRASALRLAEAVEEFLVRVEVLPWDSAAAKCYSSLRATLEDAGAPMGNLDMMIAAQAFAAEAIVVTHDRVFHRVKQLKIEDWTRT